MSVDAQLRVDGVWLGATGLPYGDLGWADRADGGNFEASWSMGLAYGERPAPLRVGAKAEIYLGPVRRWYGELTVPDWDAGTFTADGLSQRAYDFAARTTVGVTSSTPDTVIDTAIGFDGWAVTRLASFAGAPVIAGDVTEELNTVGAILDQSAFTGGKRWGVWGDGAVRAYAPPTTYDYLVAPGVIELGETVEDTFNKVIATFIDSVDSTRKLVGYPNAPTGPVRHTLQDFTNLGPMTYAAASAIAASLLALGAGSPGWTNGVDVTSAQLLTPGGLPADLAAVTAGQMIRAAVVGDRGQGYRDLVIGETRYGAGTDVLSLSPVGRVAETFSDVIEDAYTRITGQPVAA